MPLPTLLWLQGPNLEIFKTTSFVNVVVGCWTLITGVRWTIYIVLFPILISAISTLKTPPPLKPIILANALYGEIIKTVKEKFALSLRQRAVFECLRAPYAQDFMSVVPIKGLGQCMSAVEYRAILKYRLMVPLFSVDDPCPVCRKYCLDSFGEHAIHCKELPGFKYRHDLVRDVLYDILKRPGISIKKEVPVDFLTDPLEGRSTLRPADILVFGWE
ncbi:putative exostosin [Helianthus annuus]|nr:putative exostosin [Helianthus annuus]